MIRLNNRRASVRVHVRAVANESPAATRFFPAVVGTGPFTCVVRTRSGAHTVHPDAIHGRVYAGLLCKTRGMHTCRTDRHRRINTDVPLKDFSLFYSS